MSATPANAAPRPLRDLGPISAVVCNFQGEAYLPECLQSLLALGDQLDEIVVVDDGSSDGSLALLARDYPSVQVVALATNGGPCRARNEGLARARNRWVLAVDNDAVLDRDVLSKLRQALEQDPQAVLAQPRSVLHHEPTRVHYDGGRFHYVGLFVLRNFYRPLAEAEGQGTVEVDGYISICGLMDRRRILELGGFDEALFILFEDFDLSWRLRLAGERLLSVEDALVRHKSGTPGISFRVGDYPQRRAFFHSRNRWMVMLKCHSGWTLLVSLPGVLIYEAAWLAFTLKAGHFKSYAQGKLAFFKHLPRTLANRRVVQRSRRLPDSQLLVGGPLTLSPQLIVNKGGAGAARCLSRALSAWWHVMRHLMPK
jgi:GT2 family glycosyltransferase